MAHSSATPTRAHRSQEERSAATRQRVLDAAIDCLNDVGYARLTTTMVAERAGVSRGAQLHHFPTKAELVVEAVAHLARRSDEAAPSGARRPAGSDDRGADENGDAGSDGVERFLDGLWESFASPLSYATLELWIAARTDAELHDAVVGHERAAGRGISRLWRDLVGSGDDDATDELRELTFFMLRGMAVERILKRDDRRRRQLFDRWKARVVATLSARDQRETTR